jgi:hypothetical protein
MRVPLHASATDCPFPKLGNVTIGHGHLVAPTILIGPDRSTTICLPLDGAGNIRAWLHTDPMGAPSIRTYPIQRQ